MNEKVYGYARVSSADQNLARQLDALSAFGVSSRNIYTDKASGKDFCRPKWQRLVRKLQPGDILAICSIDRLGRDYTETLEQWRLLTKDIGVNIVVLDMPLLDTRSKGENGVAGALIADIVLQLLSYVAQVERENIRKRQEEGIKAAKKRGVHMGRPHKPRPRGYDSTRVKYLQGAITRKQAASRLKCGVTTFDKWIREDEQEAAF